MKLRIGVYTYPIKFSKCVPPFEQRVIFRTSCQNRLGTQAFSRFEVFLSIQPFLHPLRKSLQGFFESIASVFVFQGQVRENKLQQCPALLWGALLVDFAGSAGKVEDVYVQLEILGLLRLNFFYLALDGCLLIVNESLLGLPPLLANLLSETVIVKNIQRPLQSVIACLESS